MTIWQILFWIMMATFICLPIIIALVVSYFHQRIADLISGWYAWKIGRLIIDNNARAIAFFVLAILLTISAFIGGFGKPLLDDSVDSVVTSVKNWEPKKLPMPKEGSLLWGVLTRDGAIKITPPDQATSKIAEVTAVNKSKHYPQLVVVDSGFRLLAFCNCLFATFSQR